MALSGLRENVIHTIDGAKTGAKGERDMVPRGVGTPGRTILTNVPS